MKQGTFLGRVKAALLSYGTYDKAAEALGVSRQTVYRWTKGHSKPPAKALRAMAKKMGKTTEWIMEGRADPKSFRDLKIIKPGTYNELNNVYLDQSWFSKWMPGVAESVYSHEYASNNMSPTIMPGDVLIVDSAQKLLETGVFLLDLDGLIVHRIVRTNIGVNVQNDNPKFDAFSINSNDLDRLNVLGKIVAVVSKI